MTAQAQTTVTRAFSEVLARLEAGEEVTIEVPWLETDDHRTLVLIRQAGDRILLFDPNEAPEDAPAAGEPYEDGGPPRLAEADGLLSIACEELEARFELGEGRGYLS